MQRQGAEEYLSVSSSHLEESPKAEDYIDRFSRMNEYGQHYIYGFLCGYNMGARSRSWRGNVRENSSGKK